MSKSLFVCAVIGALALSGSAIGLAQIGAGSSASGGDAADMNAMMSNTTMPGFDPDAGLRAAQAARDPRVRVEIFAEPGDTRLELESGEHRVEAVIRVDRMPNNLDLETWPGTTLTGDYDPAAPFAITRIDLRVDGCSVMMPFPTTVLGSPSSIELNRDAERWIFTVQSNDSYRFDYLFNNKTLLSQRLSSGASGEYDADWKIAADDYGSAIEPDCLRLKPRQYGARAERKAGSLH